MKANINTINYVFDQIEIYCIVVAFCPSQNSRRRYARRLPVSICELAPNRVRFQVHL